MSSRAWAAVSLPAPARPVMITTSPRVSVLGSGAVSSVTSAPSRAQAGAGTCGDGPAGVDRGHVLRGGSAVDDLTGRHVHGHPERLVLDDGVRTRVRPRLRCALHLGS